MTHRVRVDLMLIQDGREIIKSFPCEMEHPFLLYRYAILIETNRGFEPVVNMDMSGQSILNKYAVSPPEDIEAAYQQGVRDERKRIRRALKHDAVSERDI